MRRLALPLAFLIAALPAFGGWWLAGRPQPVPDGPPGRLACVSYTPFRGDETPFDPTFSASPADIEADLRALSARTGCVRTYAVDQGLEQVPAIAERLGMTVLLGAWIGRKEPENQTQLATAVRIANRHPGTVRAIVVGNEVLLRRERNAEELAAYLRQVRAQTRVPLTYADVWEFWERHAPLAREVDFVTVHILPYWEDHPVAIEYGIVHVASIWQRMREAFAGKPVLIGEVGWPSAGRMRDGARPGLVEQARFVRGVARLAADTPGLDYNVIEAFDQPWKRLIEGTVGGHWGLWADDRSAKFDWRGPVSAWPNWRMSFAVAAGLAALLLSAAARETPGWRRALPIALAAHGAGAALTVAGIDVAQGARDPIEWAIGLGGVALGAVVAWAFLWDGCRRTPTAVWTVARVLEGLAGPRRTAWTAPFALGLAQFAFVFAAAVQTLALVFDGRYRGFPVAAFLIPAFAFLVWAWRRREREPDLEGRWLASLLALGATALVGTEGPFNTQALAWSATMLALALPWAFRRN